MKTILLFLGRAALCLSLVLCAAVLCASAIEARESAHAMAVKADPATLEKLDTPLVRALREELDRSVKKLKLEDAEAPYFISYLVNDSHEEWISSSFGTTISSGEDRNRYLDVDVRVGSHELDNTHEIRGDYDRPSYRRCEIPLDDDLAALRTAVWLETDSKYKEAVERFTKVETEKAVKVEKEDLSDDFSREEPVVYAGERAVLRIDRGKWEDRLNALSGMFKEHPDIYGSQVRLQAGATGKTFVSSEGSIIRASQKGIILNVYASTRAEDGMELYRHESYSAPSEAEFPPDSEIETGIKKIISDLKTLRDAPYVDPYVGPAILMNRASGVFFHEIFGHRIEGHRQKSEEEGQTFTKKVNEPVLPEFISVYDDPTLERQGDIFLNGHYDFDDEGIRSEKVVVVENGILRNFLMSRSPIEGFPRSNGHGRKMVGRRAVSRQGNLIIESSKTVPFKKLRKMLIEECEKQDKPYGLIFEDISGGFTFTGRYMPQAFKVIPLVVYRVYTDGRPDEMVRGVDIVGTPLTCFGKITAAGDDVDVFNGFCGAESGLVPVSAVSPSILVTEIEVEKKMKGADKPPILPPPITLK